MNQIQPSKWLKDASPNNPPTVGFWAMCRRGSNGPFFSVFSDKMVVPAETNHCSHFDMMLWVFQMFFGWFFLFFHWVFNFFDFVLSTVSLVHRGRKTKFFSRDEPNWLCEAQNLKNYRRSGKIIKMKPKNIWKTINIMKKWLQWFVSAGTTILSLKTERIWLSSTRGSWDIWDQVNLPKKNVVVKQNKPYIVEVVHWPSSLWSI